MWAAISTKPTTDGSSQALSRVLSQIAKVAPSDSTVLILGETGTGKELIARAIHKRSKRAERAFIGVNCAAIPPSSITSELFGYQKGAFTGATQRRLGRFESANGGTIFLDEVGDLPPEIQIAPPVFTPESARPPIAVCSGVVLMMLKTELSAPDAVPLNGSVTVPAGPCGATAPYATSNAPRVADPLFTANR